LQFEGLINFLTKPILPLYTHMISCQQWKSVSVWLLMVLGLSLSCKQSILLFSCFSPMFLCKAKG
jgi:hypothetical protein